MERPATPASMRNDAEQPRSDKGAASEEPATPASMRNEAAQPAAEMRTTPQDASGAASEEPSSLDGVASGAARPTAEMATQSPGHGGAASDQSSIPSVLGQRRKATAAQHTAESMGELDAVRNAAVTAAIRAQEVFEQFLTDRSKQAPSIEVWALLLASGKGLVLISDVMDWLFKHGYSAAPTGASGNTVGGIANDTIANILRLAEEIRTGRPLRVAGLHDAAPELRSASLAGLSQPGLAESPEALRAAIGLASVVDWLLQLENLLRDLEKPVAETLAVNTAARRR